MSAISLPINEFVVVSLAGIDSATPPNPAPVTLESFAIDDHSKAYAVAKDAVSVYVVSRGPAGSFRLTVNAKSAGGNTLTQTMDFTVAAGDASTLVLSASAPAPLNITIPGIPSGW